jgi:hypothetical protein
MSWQIPQQIEQDIIAGKAQYRTFQTGSGGQSILPVPPNAYAVIFGYDFSPAGGGLYFQGGSFNPASQVIPIDPSVSPFENQQISFYTGQDYYPFLHHVNISTTINSISLNNDLFRPLHEIDNTPIARQVYITSSNDVTITVGLIRAVSASANAIPVTNRTPPLLTFGGSGQLSNTQTNLGPAATPVQFMQPSPKDYAAFAFGLLPNGANDQMWASPDIANGLIDPTAFAATIFSRELIGNLYFLNLHYALYTRTIPEQRG